LLFLKQQKELGRNIPPLSNTQAQMRKESHNIKADCTFKNDNNNIKGRERV